MTPAHNSLSYNVTKLMVGGAVIAAVIMAVHYGWHKGGDVSLSIAFVIALVVVALGEVLSWHNVASSWYERRIGALVFWAILGVSLSAGTLYTNFSTAAGSGEKTAIVKTAHFNSYDNTKSDLIAARASLKTKEERLAWMNGTAVRGKAVGTLEGADAKITEAKAHKFWKTTNGCTETKGPQTREFCKNYADDQQEKALAIEKRTLETDVEGLRSRIAKLSSNVKTDVAVSDDAAHITAVASFLKTDKEHARQLDSMFLGLLVQAMMLLGGILLATETYRHLPRKAWFNHNFGWLRPLSNAWRAFFGAPMHAAAHTTAHVHHDVFGKALGGVVKA